MSHLDSCTMKVEYINQEIVISFILVLMVIVIQWPMKLLEQNKLSNWLLIILCCKL